MNRIVITGATGFVGRYVVAAALHRGHRVAAIVRDQAAAAKVLPSSPQLELLTADLRAPQELQLSADDTVVHLAAAKAGDFATRFEGTVLATERLLAVMSERGVQRLVGISTFSIYDQTSHPKNALIDENAPLVDVHTRRDDYARTKLIQERMFSDWGAADDRQHVILRPGMIWGRDEVWHALLGSPLGPRFLRIGTAAQLPLTYVENVADAIIDSAEALSDPARHAQVDGSVLNIVDDELPTQGEYVAALEGRYPVPRCVTVPWTMWRAAAGLGAFINHRWFDGRLKLPGIFVPEQLDGRFKPFRYSNEQARRTLGWRPAFDFEQSLQRSLSEEPLTPHTAVPRSEDRLAS